MSFPAPPASVHSASDHSTILVPEPELEKNSSAVDPFLVQLTPDDSSNPQNWSRLRKWFITNICAAGIVADLRRQYGFGQEVGVLVISLFVAGFVVGPLLWGPLSEEVGRKPIFVITFTVYMLFQMGMALADNTGSLLVLRFFGGVFAAGPLTNSGAVISDLWATRDRGKALAIFVAAPFAGPALGPTVAGFISVGGASWRWLFWVLMMFAGACLIAIVLFIPETYRPILLVQKAKRLRAETGDSRYYAPMERSKKTLAQQVENVLKRPFLMLVQEPMMMASTIYMSFIYGCLYLLFEAFPIVFARGHGFNAGVTGLTFLPIMVGAVLAVAVYVFVFDPMYQRDVEKYAPHPVPAESRLYLSLYAAPLFAISFFWFGVNYWAPLLAGGLIGFANVAIYVCFFNYIIDTYLMVAASALAANTVCRSIFGAVFPLFANQMYDAMDPQWASSFVGFIALIMVPIPFVFMRYGAVLRAKSKYAPVLPGPPTPPPMAPKTETSAV
ncbi:MFS general substrate transporter [Hymenopellis radicata]|nr:MFS general substrate transporter [Hymenopellis radicata]